MRHEPRRQGEDGGVRQRKRQPLDEAVRQGDDAERQDAAAEEARGEQATTALRWDGARHYVVVGHGHNAADEGVDRPEDQDGPAQRDARPGRSDVERDGDAGDRSGAPEGAEEVVGRAGAAARGEKADEELREQPPEPQDRGDRADGKRGAGQLIDQRRHDRRAVDRRRPGLEANSGCGDMCEPPTFTHWPLQSAGSTKRPK